MLFNMLFLLISPEILWLGILESIIYSLIGLVLAVLAFKVIDWVTPGNLSKQIAMEGNIALAILVGSLMIGICMIIASALH